MENNLTFVMRWLQSFILKFSVFGQGEIEDFKNYVISDSRQCPKGMDRGCIWLDHEQKGKKTRENHYVTEWRKKIRTLLE